MTACLFYLYFSIELDQTTKERNKHSHKNEETLAMFEGDDFKVENFDLFKSEFLDALRRTLSVYSILQCSFFFHTLSWDCELNNNPMF